MDDLRNNLHYQNGYFWGRRLIKQIKTTVYKDIETALKSKRELVENLKTKFEYDENEKECGEALGMIAALEEALEEQNGSKKAT